jgi:lipopolysaccharide biosynthesis glycosyltransferase
MLIPALFVAAGAATRAGNPRAYDVLLFAEPSEVTPEHRRWMAERGIELIDSLDISSLRDISIREKRLSSATLFKLLAPAHLADRYETILYLDADVMIARDIASIFLTDLGQFPLAALGAGRVRSGMSAKKREMMISHFQALGMSEPYAYINTGVMLIDIANWLRDDLGRRALDFIRKNPELCNLPDEDALNALLNGRQEELSPLWKMRAKPWSFPEVRKFTAPAIIHFDGPNKPWVRFRRNRRLGQFSEAYRAYERFIRASPWPRWLSEQWTLRDLYENLRFEFRTIARDLRRRSKSVSADSENATDYIEEFRDYCAKTAFVDERQGLTMWKDGVFYLRDDSLIVRLGTARADRTPQ